MIPWVITVAAVFTGLVMSGLAGLAFWYARFQRRKRLHLLAVYREEHLAVTAYRHAFGDFLNKLTSTNGEQP